MARALCWLSGPVVFLLLRFLVPDTSAPANQVVVLGTVAWMFLWWLFEVIPLAVTALLPLIMFPAFNVASTKSVASAYGAEVIFLFLGGFLLARAIEKWGVHHLLAQRMIGSRSYSVPATLLLFIGLTAFLSMWISNTAAALVVLPLISSVSLNQQQHSQKLQRALKLGVAYAASIGGVATLIGSPPNAIMASISQERLGVQIGFLDWMLFGVPMMIVGCAAVWLYLAFLACRIPNEHRAFSSHSTAGPSKTTSSQRRVLVVFLAAVLAWIGQGFLSIPFLSDAAIAMIASIVLFSLPSGEPSKEPLLTKEDLVFGGWPVLLLFGGGLALSLGMDQSGLGQTLADSLGGLSTLSPFLVVACLTAALILLTEFSSNTAVAAIFVPLALSIAPAVGLSSLTAMMTVTMAGSLSFMLPMATPPNAVVFASGGLTVREMMKYGLGLNIVFWILISLMVWLWLPIVWQM